MTKRLLFTVDEATYRRFRHMAIDRGINNAQLLARLLDAHEQLVTWQTARDARESVPWQSAGGPNECQPGYAAGLTCPSCTATTGGAQ